MQGFNGFPQKGRLVKIPNLFFSELLPQIDNLPELKVTLYFFWRLQQKEGSVFYLRKREIQADAAFIKGLAPRESDRLPTLAEGLERAVSRGTLLLVRIADESWEDEFYFVNTPRGRASVEGIESGSWMPKPGAPAPLTVSVERPNIFTLYEQNIGPLTPHIADNLRDFEEAYPVEWIEEAIKIAVENNVHRLTYIRAILQEWQAKGRGTDSDTDAQRFITGKYGDEIEY